MTSVAPVETSRVSSDGPTASASGTGGSWLMSATTVTTTVAVVTPPSPSSAWKVIVCSPTLSVATASDAPLPSTPSMLELHSSRSSGSVPVSTS